jgi:hypothetical protein
MDEDRLCECGSTAAGDEMAEAGHAIPEMKVMI